MILQQTFKDLKGKILLQIWVPTLLHVQPQVTEWGPGVENYHNFFLLNMFIIISLHFSQIVYQVSSFLIEVLFAFTDSLRDGLFVEIYTNNEHSGEFCLPDLIDKQNNNLHFDGFMQKRLHSSALAMVMSFLH